MAGPFSAVTALRPTTNPGYEVDFISLRVSRAIRSRACTYESADSTPSAPTPHLRSDACLFARVVAGLVYETRHARARTPLQQRIQEKRHDPRKVSFPRLCESPPT